MDGGKSEKKKNCAKKLCSGKSRRTAYHLLSSTISFVVFSSPCHPQLIHEPFRISKPMITAKITYFPNLPDSKALVFDPPVVFFATLNRVKRELHLFPALLGPFDASLSRVGGGGGPSPNLLYDIEDNENGVVVQQEVTSFHIIAPIQKMTGMSRIISK